MTWTRFFKGQLALAWPLYRVRAALAVSAKVRLVRLTKVFGRVLPLTSAQRAMVNLSQRGARVQFLYAAGDPGIELLEREFGAGGRDLQDADIHFVAAIDHSLSLAEMRQIANDYMVTFLKRSWHAGDDARLASATTQPPAYQSMTPAVSARRSAIGRAPYWPITVAAAMLAMRPQAGRERPAVRAARKPAA
jgi:hypothetical protein